MAVGDFDRDGLPDLATADAGSNRVTVLRNNGDGTFSTLATPATGNNPLSVAVADFDRDGLPDLATADADSNRVTVLRNDGDGTFSTLATPATGSYPSRWRSGLRPRRPARPRHRRLRLRPRDRAAQRRRRHVQHARHPRHRRALPHSVAVADFDRDGRPDLATADFGSNRVTVLRAAFLELSAAPAALDFPGRESPPGPTSPHTSTDHEHRRRSRRPDGHHPRRRGRR